MPGTRLDVASGSQEALHCHASTNIGIIFEPDIRIAVYDYSIDWRFLKRHSGAVFS